MISKTPRPPDLTTIQDALNIMQTEAKDIAEETANVIKTVKVEMMNNAADIKRSIKIGGETKAVAREATERSKTVVDMVKEMKDKTPPARPHGHMSYAAVAANAVLASGMPNDWVCRVGNGANIRNPTYGVLAYGIHTSTMEMDNFEEVQENILQDNRPKSASSVIIEFTRPEDANKIIDEGLVWQGELFQCERYERLCRLKQCFKCQNYGHKATTACGYCAQEHNCRDCLSKTDRTATRKCAACGGAHEAWNQNCPTRKEGARSD
ncbi:hypothetical protein KC320_g5990 [Hortaea werneckii]|nr:hypothetical protein KC320_g5990 [Hortaea werneckii]